MSLWSSIWSVAQPTHTSTLHQFAAFCYASLPYSVPTLPRELRLPFLHLSYVATALSLSLSDRPATVVPTLVDPSAALPPFLITYLDIAYPIICLCPTSALGIALCNFARAIHGCDVDLTVAHHQGFHIRRYTITDTIPHIFGALQSDAALTLLDDGAISRSYTAFRASATPSH
jgi:hypothetical protein